MSDLVFLGEEVSLPEMLKTREERVRLQNELLKEHLQSALLVVTMNIPGPIKNSMILQQTFDQMVLAIKDVIPIAKMLERHLKTGSEFYAISPLSAIELKEKMIALEEGSASGRLFDLDVHYWQEGNVSISRQDLGYAPRRCLICQREAKECGRKRRHSVKEMQEKICELLEERTDE